MACHDNAERTTEPATTCGEPLFSAMALLVSRRVLRHAPTPGDGLLYGPVWASGDVVSVWSVGLVARGAARPRALGQRNPARPVEVVTHLCAALAGLWLLRVFPFDFTHVAAVLPADFQFLLAWMSDGIGKFLLLLQVAVGMLAVVFTLGTFLWVTATLNSRRA